MLYGVFRQLIKNRDFIVLSLIIGILKARRIIGISRPLWRSTLLFQRNPLSLADWMFVSHILRFGIRLRSSLRTRARSPAIVSQQIEIYISAYWRAIRFSQFCFYSYRTPKSTVYLSECHGAILRKVTYYFCRKRNASLLN